MEFGLRPFPRSSFRPALNKVVAREYRALATSMLRGRSKDDPSTELHATTADYFKTLEIPVRAGRDFDLTDTPERPRVAMVDDTGARRLQGSRPSESAFRPGPIAGRVNEEMRRGSRGSLAGPARTRAAVIYAASTQGAGDSLSILAQTWIG